MSDKWEVKSDSWISPMELLFNPAYPSRRYWVENTETGEWRVLQVEDGQEVGDAIANGQFADSHRDSDAAAGSAMDVDSDEHDDGGESHSDTPYDHGSADTSYSSGDYYHSTESAVLPPPLPLPPLPPPPPPPDPRALQLARAAAMSARELEREIDLRIHEEVARRGHPQYTPHSPSTVPLVTREDLIRFTVLDKNPLPHVVWLADDFFKQDPAKDGWGHFARLFVEARAAADPMIKEALEGLREQGNCGRWMFPDKSPEWSLSEYVRDLRNTRRERQEAADEARRQEEKKEAVRRASTPGRQLLRLSLALIGILAVAVFVGLPVIVGRLLRAIFGDHWSLRWLRGLESFLRDAREHLPPSRVAEYIRTGQ